MNTTIIIFANSVKHGGYCIAGKDELFHQWVRLVSNVEGKELDHRFKGIQPLQKIEMNFPKHVPLMTQPENHLMPEKLYSAGRLKISDLINYLDTPNSLWGRKNCVGHAQVINITHSLYLVKVCDLHLFRTSEGKRRARFNYAGICYNLPVTDPNFEQHLVKPEHREILCVSLGEKYDPAGGENYSHYKIVATIL